MKQIDIRFTQEKDRKKAEYQAVMIAVLQDRLPKRIAEKFADVQVRIRFSSSAGVEVTGFKDKDEKSKFMEYLEELWADDSLVEI
ncbi:DinI-like family protein [Actinobacillus porcinus]|uniref:DinI-like family protein n=1 Tax=Actinobacillus porcinus TaxID=51048 RepID=UPI0023520E25|nr:DinI-like family protein [Actinobacillus porcinus]